MSTSASDLLHTLNTAPWWHAVIAGLVCVGAAFLCVSWTQRIEQTIGMHKAVGCIPLLLAFVLGGFGFTALVKGFIGVP